MRFWEREDLRSLFSTVSSLPSFAGSVSIYNNVRHVIHQRAVSGQRTPSSFPASLDHPKGKDVAQKLVNKFVHREGLSVSQMIRKGVETRDWLSTTEPRTVRAVMKRVVEELTVIDQQVRQLFEEGNR